jgi:predicted membrane-bound mannosyltransferase
VASLFYSSFFSHPRGIVDFLAAYSTYLSRAAANPWHVHPWHYYLGLLLRGVPGDGPFWTEAAILGLPLVGLAAVFARGNPRRGVRGPLVFPAAYAVLLIAAYSAIPYKTPWCVTGFLDACAVVGGVGAAWVIQLPRSASARFAVSAVVAAVVVHLGWLAWSASYPFASDPRNPYVYAHTGTGVFEIAGRVDALARVHPRGSAMPIEVISGRNLWPLPWYLRRFSHVRWETAPVDDGVPAPLILATPDMETVVGQKLYEWRRPGERELYVPIFDSPVELRPLVEVRGYAAKSLWDRAVVR